MPSPVSPPGFLILFAESSGQSSSAVFLALGSLSRRGSDLAVFLALGLFSRRGSGLCTLDVVFNSVQNRRSWHENCNRDYISPAPPLANIDLYSL